MTLNTFSAGVDTSFSTKLNNNFNSFKIQEIYTGNSFNVAGSATSTTTVSANAELTAITPSAIGNANYLVIEVTCYSASDALAGGSSGTYGRAQLTYQTKYVGGAYADSMAAQTISYPRPYNAAGGYFGIAATQTISWVHTLTANEKANGVQVKIIADAVLTCASSNTAKATITNIQTVLKLLA